MAPVYLGFTVLLNLWTTKGIAITVTAVPRGSPFGGKRTGTLRGC